MLKPLKKLDQPPLLSHSAQETIKEYIIANQLKAGDALPPETELTRQLGISRNSVREAVKGLSALGIIEVRRGSGLFVGQFSFEPLLNNLSYGVLFELQQLADLLEVRQVLETGMIEPALQHMSDAQRAQLQHIVEQMRERAERGETFLEEDRAFHRCLFAGLNNAIVLRLLDTFWLTFRKASEHRNMETRDPMQTYRDHAAIVEAVLANDVEQVRSMLQQHYAGIAGRLTRACEAHL